MRTTVHYYLLATWAPQAPFAVRQPVRRPSGPAIVSLWQAWVAQQDLPHVDRRALFLAMCFTLLLIGVMLTGS